MPSKKTGQTITPTPRKLKQAFDMECARLKSTVKFKGSAIYPGHVLNGFMTRFVAMPDESEREKLAQELVKEYEDRWATDPESVDAGPNDMVNIGVKVDRLPPGLQSVDRITNKARPPKRRG
jgi:hypothetical protein